jgi:hypothetical protein
MKNFLLVTSGNEYRIYSLMFNIKMNELTVYTHCLDKGLLNSSLNF